MCIRDRIYPQRGSVVAPIDYNLVEEAQFVRSVLEVAVVQLACERATQEQLEQLKESVALQEFYYQHGSSERLLEMDDEFHRLLFQIAGDVYKRQVHSCQGSAG